MFKVHRMKGQTLADLQAEAAMVSRDHNNRPDPHPDDGAPMLQVTGAQWQEIKRAATYGRATDESAEAKFCGLEVLIAELQSDHAAAVLYVFRILATTSADFLMRMEWWGKKTPLESLMLVVSEAGEAANEVRADQPTDHFPEELADIVLRVIGLAAEQNVDLGAAIIKKIDSWQHMQPGHKGRAK